MLQQILEAELGKTEAVFGFSAEKRWKMAIYSYFSESGRPKTDIRKFMVLFGAWGSRGPPAGTLGSFVLAGARFSVHEVRR